MRPFAATDRRHCGPMPRLPVAISEESQPWGFALWGRQQSRKYCRAARTGPSGVYRPDRGNLFGRSPQLWYTQSLKHIRNLAKQWTKDPMFSEELFVLSSERPPITPNW